MVKVYFETENGSYAEIVATFETEELFIICLPALKKEAKKQGYILTETIEEEKEEAYSDFKNNVEEKHDKLKEILIDFNSPEFGDCIVDDICSLFNFPDTTEIIDLFEFYEDQPKEVSSILEQFGNFEELDYEQLKAMQLNLETIGYTFEYGLDAQPFNLRKI